MTKQAKCPNCGAQQTAKYSPFCSARCADLDLHRWLSGSYVIAGRSDDDEDGRPHPGLKSNDPSDDEN